MVAEEEKEESGRTKETPFLLFPPIDATNTYVSRGVLIHPLFFPFQEELP